MEFLSRIRLRRKRPNQNPNFHLTNNNININININAEEEMEETRSDSVTINNANKPNDSFTDGNREEMKEEKTSEGTSSSSSTTEEEKEEDGDLSSCSEVGEMKKKRSSTDTPPTDDCCPICFGSFTVACRASCGHWYCELKENVTEEGACILQYWNYGAALQPCKCPMCFRQITWLRPEASLYHQQEVEVTDVLKKVQKYNRLFVGGTYGLFLVFLGALYTISPFDFLPTGRMMSAIDIFDYSAIALSFILYFVGLYLRRRRLQNARQLAIMQP
ncbi:hypothetical protein LguiA_027072 [Lonicera macranthoides]